MSYDEELVSRMRAATGDFKPEQATHEGSDHNQLVTIVWSADDQISVELSRTLISDPHDRADAQRAISEAVRNLVASREAGAAALGAEIGRVMAAGAAEALGTQTREAEQRTRDFVNEIRSRQEAIAQRRARRK